jgi:nucleoside-triphosphatase THEP1
MANKKGLIKINSDELKTFMTHIVDNNRFLQAGGKVPVSVNIEGDAGLGKTSVALQLSKELGLNYVRINLAEIEELGDLVGYPVRQFQLCKQGVVGSGKAEKIPKYEIKTIQKQTFEAGKMVLKSVDEKVQVGWTEVPAVSSEDQCLWIDEQATEEYIKRGFDFTGEKRMSYCPPEWITGLTGGGFLILDDYTRADLRFIQACMTLN